ncbi:hypothetical protein B7745_12205 [Mycobacterium tuberculosis]|nr:hypothetical protein B7745_12205 [Mycobacterium tuberculosis]
MPRFALPGTSTSRQPIALGRDPQTGTSPNLARIARLNRPGMSGDSSSWKGWGHVRWFIEEVPAGAA